MAKRPKSIFWCPCGAMLRGDRKGWQRHLKGDTVCQHRHLYRFTFANQQHRNREMRRG